MAKATRTKEELSARYAGFVELDKFLKQFVPEVTGRIATTGLRAAAKPIFQSAKENVKSNRRTGKLENSIVINSEKKDADIPGGSLGTFIGPSLAGAEQTRIVKIGFRPPASRRAHLLEYGHGGPAPAPAYPFMTPALDSQGHNAIDAAEKSIRANINRTAKKLGGTLIPKVPRYTNK